MNPEDKVKRSELFVIIANNKKTFNNIHEINKIKSNLFIKKKLKKQMEVCFELGVS